MSVESSHHTEIKGQQDNIALLDIAVLLAKHRRLLLGVPSVVAAVALAIAFVLPNVYTGTARILPPQQKDSSVAAMLGVFAGQSAFAGGGAVGQALGIRNPIDLYVGILKSRTIADRIIERFNLKDLYHASTMVSAREALQNVATISATRDGIIAIDVEDEDPKRAAEMANAYVEELDQMMQGLAVTEASQRRLFFEKQLFNARNQLASAEAGLRRALESKGISGVEAQGRSLVTTTEQLRAQIAVKEIQLDAMRAYATGRNPEAVRMTQELTSMKDQLANLESGRREPGAGHSPAGLENLHKLRELKFVEFTVELLSKQYELARIDEARDAVVIQVVDKALPPDKKSKPKRAVIVFVSTVTALLIVILIILSFEALGRIRTHPVGQARLSAFKSYLRGREAKSDT
jgi:tyrosine-protein kinase Etk/Wzc